MRQRDPIKARESRQRYLERHPEQRGNCPRPSTIANRALILAAKDVPCVDCGEQDVPERMHFDHVRGEKKFELGGNAARRSRKSIEAELAKCEVRCVQCHSKRHRAIQLLRGRRPERRHA